MMLAIVEGLVIIGVAVVVILAIMKFVELCNGDDHAD
jgi:hypothetical protein